MSDNQFPVSYSVNNDAETVAADVIQLTEAYSLGGEVRLRDEFDRIFSHRSILERYLRRQMALGDAAEIGELTIRIHALTEELES